MPYFDQKFLFWLSKEVKLLRRYYEYLYAQTASEEGALKQVATTSSPGVTWSGDGKAATPLQITLSPELAGFSSISTNGIIARTASGTFASRTITGTPNLITITNADGVSGNPTITVGTNVVQTTTTQTLTNKTLTSPSLTGTPTSPTAAPGTNTTQIATTAFVTAAITAGSVSAANPTASIGLTAVNGAASTFMRSDAAPRIDQNIAPNWTGKHIFSKTGDATNPAVVVSSNDPQFELEVPGAAVDTRRWNMTASLNTFAFRTLTDNGTTGNNFWLLNRNANNIVAQTWYTGSDEKLHLTSTDFKITANTTLGGAIYNASRIDNTLAITISATDYIIILTDATGGSGTIALPDPTVAANAGRTVIIMNAGTSNYTTDRPFVSTVDPADTTISANESVTLHCQNNNWYQISS
jgi:hypothetical protein